MDTVANRLHETGAQLARQHSAFLTRTRQAGSAFLDETRDAGRQLLVALQSEGRRWRRFAFQRTAQLRGEARAVLSLPAVEKTVLSQLDVTLKEIDSRVRARLAEIEGPARKTAKTAKRRKAAPRARRSRQTLPAMAA